MRYNMTHNKKPKGYIIYEGASLIDGKPIVEIAILSSKNIKTGNMIQTYILRQDINPLEANKSGQDVSICGDCPHKGTPHKDPTKKTAKNRSCYVNLGQGVLIVYKQYLKGAYPKVNGHDAIAEIGKDKLVRIGTYGDGSAVPAYVNESLVSKSKAHTAYSHQGQNANTSFNPSLYMVSADSKADAIKAWSKGYRTFRVTNNLDLDANEILCPASKEAGYKTTCQACKLCGGASVKAKSIAIVAHGAGSTNFAGVN